MGMIKLQRTKDYANSLRDYIIYIDGVKAGVIANGQTKELPLEPGRHTLYCKIDWCSSPEIGFDVTGNETKNFQVGSFRNSNWIAPLSLGIVLLTFIVPDRLSLYLTYLLIPAFLLLIYYFTIGRKKYLSLTEISAPSLD
jgi:hypothetical protein